MSCFSTAAVNESLVNVSQDNKPVLQSFALLFLCANVLKLMDSSGIQFLLICTITKDLRHCFHYNSGDLNARQAGRPVSVRIG